MNNEQKQNVEAETAVARDATVVASEHPVGETVPEPTKSAKMGAHALPPVSFSMYRL